MASASLTSALRRAGKRVLPRRLRRAIRGAERAVRRLERVGDPRRQIYYGLGPRVMSALRKRWILFTHPHANIIFEGPVHIGPGFTLYIPGPGTLIVGPNVEFRRGFRAEIVARGRVKIGANSVLSYHTLIQCTTEIEIGEGCGLGQSCAIFDGNHKYRDPDQPFLEQGFDLHPVRIGDHCAVLTKTTVIADVGDHAVIGANSVVVRPIPPFTVAAGVPARVIDYFGPEDDRPVELAESSSDSLRA